MPSSGTSTASRPTCSSTSTSTCRSPNGQPKKASTRTDILERVTAATDKAAADRAERFGPEIMQYVERSVILQTLDHLWREHIVNLDHLRSVIGFRGYAQRDPLQEYKSEAFELFQALLGNLRQAVTAQLMRVELVREAAEAPQPAPPLMEGHHIDPLTGEDDFGRGVQLAAGGRTGKPQPGRPVDLGQGLAQRSLPVRFRQEVQALPRNLRSLI